MSDFKPLLILDALHDLPPLKDIIAEHDLRAQKSLGQNFLLDLNITDKIARLAFDSLKNPNSTHLFEVGPGPGGLTRSLLKLGTHGVTAIEFDERAIHALQSLKEAAQGHLTLIHGDAMESDLMDLSNAPKAIVANLPYNIATPLLIGWLEQIRDYGLESFESLTLMFQKEVAERIIADQGSKAYGRLAVLAQWLCDTRIVYHLPPSAFTPPPKVDSAVVQLIPRALEKDSPAVKTMESLTALAFGQRRKMIRQSLKPYMAALDTLGIDPTLRAEALSVRDFINLARTIEEMGLA